MQHSVCKVNAEDERKEQGNLVTAVDCVGEVQGEVTSIP